MTDNTTEELTRDDRTELFLAQVRGTIASAFNHSGVSPLPEEWAAIRGEIDLTMRQIGEIGHRTGFNMHINLIDRVKP